LWKYIFGIVIEKILSSHVVRYDFFKYTLQQIQTLMISYGGSTEA